MARLITSLNTHAALPLVAGFFLVFSVGCDSSNDDTPQNDDTDNCPLIENSDQTDTDGDGEGDACDTDDDNDGFQDVDDPAPLDSSRPGDFLTPEAILDNEVVQAALASAENAGFPVVAETGQTPPLLTGYYNRTAGSGKIVSTSNNTDIGRSLVGAESRIVQNADNEYSSASVSFTENMPVFYAIADGSVIRGEGNLFSRFSRGKSICTEAGSDFTVFGVSITSGEWEPDTGNIINARRMGVTIETQGELTAACANRIAGAGEMVGESIVYEYPLSTLVQPTSLIYMCVDDDGDAAYAPTETWTAADGQACSCTQDFMISCE